MIIIIFTNTTVYWYIVKVEYLLSSVSNKQKKPRAIWALAFKTSRALTFFTGPNKFTKINRTSQVHNYMYDYSIFNEVFLMKLLFSKQGKFYTESSQLTKLVLICRICILMCIVQTLFPGALRAHTDGFQWARTEFHRLWARGPSYLKHCH